MARKKQPKAFGVWGIEIGQCGLKALRLEKVEDRITATAFDYIEYPKILNQPDADPDQLTREALQKFLERNNLKGDQVVLGVPGQIWDWTIIVGVPAGFPYRTRLHTTG